MQPNRLNFWTVLVILGVAGLLAYFIRETSRLQQLAQRQPQVVYKQVPAPAAKVRTIIKTNEFSWSQLESEDYRTYINRLHAVGCPDETIRDIIIADVEKLMAPRMKEVMPVESPKEYWQPDEKELQDPLAFQMAAGKQLEIDFEKRDVIRELIGVDLVAERAKVAGQEDAFGKKLSFLPEDKRAEIRKVIERFNRAEVALREKVWADGDFLTAEDESQLHQLAKQREAQIQSQLAPEEMKQYELRLSPTAYKVRDSLFGMNASEREFSGIFELQKGFEQKWGDTPDNDAGKQAATKTLQDDLKKQLGEARYREYERAQDPDFRQLSVAVVRNNLPREKANEAYEIKRIAVAQRQKVEASGLAPQDKKELIDEISQETQRTLMDTLGEKAFGSFLRRGDASWLK